MAVFTKDGVFFIKPRDFIGAVAGMLETFLVGRLGEMNPEEIMAMSSKTIIFLRSRKVCRTALYHLLSSYIIPYLKVRRRVVMNIFRCTSWTLLGFSRDFQGPNPTSTRSCDGRMAPNPVMGVSWAAPINH